MINNQQYSPESERDAHTTTLDKKLIRVSVAKIKIKDKKY